MSLTVRQATRQTGAVIPYTNTALRVASVTPARRSRPAPPPAAAVPDQPIPTAPSPAQPKEAI